MQREAVRLVKVSLHAANCVRLVLLKFSKDHTIVALAAVQFNFIY